MLTPEYLLHVSEGAEEIAARLHTDIVKQIARRVLARQQMGADYILTAADKWRIQSLLDAGYMQDDIAEDIAKATRLEKAEVAEAFRDAGVTATKYDDEVYEAMGLPTGGTQSPYFTRLMQRNYEATMGTWENYARTTADASQQTFISTMDDIYTKVATGSQSYTEAFTEAINKLAETGVVVLYPSGHKDTIETATLRCVRTGISQASAQIQMARMDEFGVDLVVVSSHMGARPSHQVWQGKVYSRSGSSEKYPDFVSSTGYGTGDGLCGWNCRHNFSPYYEGMKNPFDHYTKKENNELYEKTQKQRSMERAIRKTKREAEVLKDAAGNAENEETANDLGEAAKKAREKLQRQMDAYSRYCRENDLRPLPERLKIARAGRLTNDVNVEPRKIAKAVTQEPERPGAKDVGDYVREIRSGASTDRETLGKEILKDYNVSGVTVRVANIQDHGNCSVGVERGKLRVDTYNLNKGDQRSAEYQIKTAFHEAYHASGNGFPTDMHMVDSGKWLDIEETFAECSAHYSAGKYGITGLTPSYADKLVKMLPRLKKLPEFSSCKTVSDFGKIALEERLKGGGSVWKDLYTRAMRKRHSYSDFVKKYFPIIRSDTESAVDKILENMPQCAPYKKQMIQELESGMNNIEKYGFALSDNETMLINNAVAFLLNTMGVM